MAIKILLVDDNDRLRDSLGTFLVSLGGLAVVGTAATGKEALQQCAKVHPDVVLMDLRMPDMNGIEATRRIHQQYPDIQILVLTSGFVTEAEAALEAGAKAYLLKTVSAYTIIDAIRSLYAASHPH
jgi:two-component system, NarL family, response regulator LiaR